MNIKSNEKFRFTQQLIQLQLQNNHEPNWFASNEPVYHWSILYIRVRVVYNFIKIVLRLTDIDCEKGIKEKKNKPTTPHTSECKAVEQQKFVY